MGQLIREDNRDKGYSYVYTYDNAGNITSKKRYAFTTGILGDVQQTYSYSYNDSTWKDLLTSYNGTSITYDTIGNPLSIGSKELTWQSRELQSYFDGDYTTTTYSYNADGIRTRKVIYNEDYDETETHEYILSGSQIIRETVYLDEIEQYTLVYIYDELGAPIGIKYRTPSYAENVYDCYFFEKNLQGDIVAIYNASGAKIVTYVYDAWGNVTTKITSGTASKDRNLANNNPFRYRGYYYDTDIGMYYLQSRYYNPEWGRFLNGDRHVSTGTGMLGYNMFAYCGNNPVNRVDPIGEAWWHWALGAAVVAACAVATIVTCGGVVAAATAVGMVASGGVAFTTSSTVAAAAFLGSSTLYGMFALSAATSSNSMEEFYEQGSWWTVAGSAGGVILGGIYGYVMGENQNKLVNT